MPCVLIEMAVCPRSAIPPIPLSASQTGLPQLLNVANPFEPQKPVVTPQRAAGASIVNVLPNNSQVTLQGFGEGLSWAYSGQFLTKVLSEAKRKNCKLFEGVSPSFCDSAERT